MSPASDFLARVFGDCDAGVIEVRGYPSGERCWVPLGDWARVDPFLELRRTERDNTAVGVATRRDTTSGTSLNLAQLPVVFVDIDQPPRVARAQLGTFPFPPHLVVHSGLGAHFYWKLKEPLDLRDAATRTFTTTLLHRLTAYLGGDDRATDTSRILRLPGTQNHKYDYPRNVVLADTRAGALDASELDEFLPRLSRATRTGLDNVVHVGARNDMLYRQGRSMRARGCSVPLLVETLETFNRVFCCPPLPAEELRRLLNQVLTQPDRPDFALRPRAQDKQEQRATATEKAGEAQR